jgi:hypothetical protein
MILTLLIQKSCQLKKQLQLNVFIKLLFTLREWRQARLAALTNNWRVPAVYSRILNTNVATAGMLHFFLEGQIEKGRQ